MADGSEPAIRRHGLDLMAAPNELMGSILDADSHEMVPAQLWGEAFGPASAELAPMFLAAPEGGPNSFNVPIEKDDSEINAHNIWTIKNGRAPGAVDPNRRLAVMDFVGVRRQLIFPSSVGITGAFFSARPSPADLAFVFKLDASTRDWPAFGQVLVREYNDWAIRTSKVEPDRMRAVAYLCTYDLEEAIAEARRVTREGVRVVHIASAVPPGGLSPADPKLDDFWNYFAANDITVTLHLGGEYTFLRSHVWEDAPIFAGKGILSPEVLPNPFRFSTVHLPSQNFLTAMILGGVFERHPRLRVGIIEVGAHWVGPMAENLERWVHWFRHRYKGVLSSSPAEYLKRNVRVTPFYFEPVATYIDRHGLEDVYCYSSDWPHFEGGTNPFDVFLENLAPLGEGVVKKFFVENAELLMPA